MTLHTSAPRNALFDRLGGLDGLERGVARLFERLAATPELARLIPADGRDDARWQVQMLLTDLLGGPMAYDGPEAGALAHRLEIGAGLGAQLIGEVIASFADTGADPGQAEELREILQCQFAAAGIGGESGPQAGQGTQAIVTLVQAAATRAGVSDRPLCVLNPELTVIHLSPEAERTLAGADGELRRAFGLGAADLMGQSILRFHPAPTQLQGLLQDVSRLPHETTWCFGRAVWKARLLAAQAPDGAVLGYGVAWRDESDLHRAEAVFRRLRSQAEDLPVPIMYPDSTIEKWFGNAACETALARLAPYLPFQVNPLDGVPVRLFLPDEQERRALFRDPARLPFKTQLKMGPETIAVLVSPVLDQDQRYLGPQITWEIVHFTRPAPQPEPAVAASVPVATALPAPPAPTAAMASPSSELRGEARALEAAAGEVQMLVRLLDLIADQSEGHDALRVTEMPATSAGTGPAREAELAIATALAAVQRAVEDATAALASETRDFAAGLTRQVHESLGRTQGSAEALGRVAAAAAGLAELRSTLGEPIVPPSSRSLSQLPGSG